MTQPQWLIFYPIPWTRLPIHRIESKGTGVHILMAGTISPWTVICNTNLLLNRTIAQWSSVMAQKYGMLLIQNLSWIYTDSCERECQRSSKSRSGFLPQGKLTGWVRINRDRHSQHNNITIVVKIGSLHWKKRLACNNVVENRPEQYCSAKQCWTILLTNRNNMGSKILSMPVFNNIVTGWAFFCSVGWVGNISKRDTWCNRSLKGPDGEWAEWRMYTQRSSKGDLLLLQCYHTRRPHTLFMLNSSISSKLFSPSFIGSSCYRRIPKPNMSYSYWIALSVLNRSP
jgi:hypothetical protein